MKNQPMQPLLLLALMLGLVAAAQARVDFTDLVEESIPAVVNVETTRFGSRPSEQPAQQRGEGLPDLFGDLFGMPPRGGQRPQPDRRGSGSGFIFDSNGLILTNHHVVDGADEIIVRLADRREFEAELLGSDAETDIAVLRIEADGLPTLSFGETESLRQGEWVIAIGSPFSFEQSVTAGIVSGKGRTQQSAQQQYVPFIQTDVAINRGNSGGPLIRTDGTVVGINSWILSSHGGNIGLSFAIPVEVAQSSVEQLLEFGRVRRGWLGVGIQVINRETAEALGLDRPSGALVNRVEPDSPAAKANIEVGDVILRFNGMMVDVFSDLPPLVGMVRPGTEVPVEISRQGERQTITVTIEQREEDEDIDDDAPSEPVEPANALGLAVEPIDTETRRRLGDPQGGVLVVDVQSDAAYRAGVRRGQAILMVNNQQVAGIDDFNRIADTIEPGRSVALLLQRSDGNTSFVAYTPESDD